MALKGLDTASLPERTSTGGQSSIPEAEQAQLLSLVTSGQSASDGNAYASTKEATKAASPYKRFLRRQINAGNLGAGSIRIVTFPVDAKGKATEDPTATQRGWAVVYTAGESDEAATAE